MRCNNFFNEYVASKERFNENAAMNTKNEN